MGTGRRFDTDLADALERARTLPEAVGADLQAFGGFLQCGACGHREELGDVGSRLRDGWPKCCGYTMTWWTQRQIDAGEAPRDGAAS